MKLVTTAIIFLLVAFVIKFSRLILKRVSEKYKFTKKINALEPVIIMLAWIIVIFWSIYYLFKEKPYYHFIVIALILVLLLAISWFFVKDYMAGIAFKVQNNYSLGDIVQFGNVAGKLDALLLTHASIYTKDGKLVKIPYSKLSNEMISGKSRGSSFDNNVYVLKIPKKHDTTETQIAIQNILNTSPWRIAGKLPSVTLKSELDNFIEFEIHFETRNEKHFNYVTTYLRKRFEVYP